jgi:dinuclear metal center YbgI/SA1388 family protein
MKLKTILDTCNTISPFELQESWDNSGLQIGALNDTIESVVLALEVDESLLKTLKPHTLLITHHPLIFSGLKCLDFETFPAKLIQIMVQNNISLIAMHTNFDKTHLNKYVALEVLKKEIIKQDDFLAYMQYDMAWEDFCQSVQKAFGLQSLKTVSCNTEVKKVALCTGSGASLLPHVEADCFLTGDIKYHDAMQAKALGISMIDIGHYESERFFSEILLKELKNFGIQAIISNSINPFDYK